MLKTSSKPTKVGKKRKQVDVLFTHKQYQEKKIKELGQKASQEIQAQMAPAPSNPQQQNNNSSIAQFLGTANQNKDVNMKKK